MNTGLRRRPLARITSVLAAASIGVAGAVFSIAVAPGAAQAASSVGGQISRAEMMTRAANWYARRNNSDMTYSQTSYTWDGTNSRKYRRDCSGYVDMSWHLGADPTTDGLLTASYVEEISRAELQPGDALDDAVETDGQHAVIFGGWENAAHTTFWYYSFGHTPLNKATGASFSDSTLSGHATSQYRAIRYRNVRPEGTSSVYGVLADNRLTYSPIDVRTGVRGATRTSTTALPFTPVAMATLNFNTILLTDSAGKLYRVDVVTNSSSLVYNAPIVIGASGWTHDLLAADGAGHLFGIAGDTLRRYTITAAKPTASNITANTVIDSGFTLKTLTAVGANRILGTTAAGALRSYLINGAGAWDGATLRSSTWTFTHMLSPGAGIYFARNSGGALIRYYDFNITDGGGDDITNLGAVDDSGWTQKLLSAQPSTALA